MPLVFLNVSHPSPPAPTDAESHMVACRAEARATATPGQRVGLALLESGGIIGSMFSAWPGSVMAKEAAEAFYRCAAARGYEVHAPSFSMLPMATGS